MRVVLSLMFLVHLLHVWAFWLAGDERAAAPAHIVQWRDLITVIHEITAVAVFGLVLAVFLLPARSMRWFAPLAGATYLVHAGAIAGADQLNAPTVTPYMAYAIVVSMLLVIEPAPGVVMYAIGLVAYFAGLLTGQPDPEILRAFVLNGPSVTIAGTAILAFLYRARRRDFAQRRTISAQQEQLESWNAELEKRVDAQVQEIREHAAEVGRLNSQLQAQVRDRSRELALALEKLAHAPEPAAPTLEGRVLGGRFELLGRIGAGGMGAVYEGVDQTTRQRVAVKVVRGDVGAPVALLRRFLREAEAVASLDHPAIVRMLHVDIAEDGTFFQVQELIQGETLSRVLARHVRFGPPVVARLLAVLCDALATAHAAEIVHRDIKPGNLMFTPVAPGLKLLDFGVAKLRQALQASASPNPGGLSSDGPQAPEGEGFGADFDLPTTFDGETVDGDGQELTRTGAIIGTPGYMGPEQLAGSSEATPRSDLFAVGVLGYLALTGEHPLRMPRTSPPDLAADAPHAPEALVSCIRRCMAPNPANRPSAGEVAAELTALADALGAPGLETLVVHDALRTFTTDSEATLTQGPELGGSAE
ncbi:MAG: protein kinase [Myxococcota bacterium]